MTPSRSAMAKMLSICEKYAAEMNLDFSTDPDPQKSKSKSIFMTGTRLRLKNKPANLQLYNMQHTWGTSWVKMAWWTTTASVKGRGSLTTAHESERHFLLQRQISFLRPSKSTVQTTMAASSGTSSERRRASSSGVGTLAQSCAGICRGIPQFIL